jgi:cap1 methyltransferase
MQQLVQVKRRLGPAAERAVEAANSLYRGYKTTSPKEFEQARRVCNPFEVLGEGRYSGLNTRFMNRSAIKLANIDAALGFCLVEECNARRSFLFVDLCGAPGGFSEYVMWRCRDLGVPDCRGYGMSLVGANDQGHGIRWKLVEDQNHNFHGMTSSTRYRICHGADGTGDIYNWQNLEFLRNTIANDLPTRDPSSEKQNDTGLVQLVVADGGFDAQRDAENQEEMAQKLIVCEAAACLSLLQQGGTFVIKMFGFQTPVIRAMMNHLFYSFDSLVTIKPISSRPASAERYVVCKGFHGNPIGWEGKQWCNRMFLGQSAQNTTADVQVANHLYRNLDEFDRDMLNLNLKACFTILSHLENKGKKVNFEEVEERPIVNIAAYRYAWRLA